ncbi:MAG: hypothetical protein BHW55_00895 [Candidatus Melainabacteria bacterium 35_41]|nr:MAG: hypothetical protein BHW55_00895 [Candidatus Melainabacteria bacterium 35_41]
MFENYKAYLKFLDERLNKFFERQKPYIFCKKGCAKCCKHAQFPYSLTEISYLLNGVFDLDIEVQSIIEQNVHKTIEDKKNCKEDKFLYDCPFLVNNECVVYKYRGVVCRTFGLMSVGENSKIKVPFCYAKGLNYSNVMDKNGKEINIEKFKNLHVEEEPLAFNISYKFLTDSDFERGFNFKFGDKKPLIDWFINDEKTKIKLTNYNKNFNRNRK